MRTNKVGLLTPEERKAFYGDGGVIKGTKAAEIVQSAADMVKDKARLARFTARVQEEGIPFANALQKYFKVPGVNVPNLLLWDAGIDFNSMTLEDIAGSLKYQEGTKQSEFWRQNGACMLVSACLEDANYQGILGDANCVTRNASMYRSNRHTWADKTRDRQLDIQTRDGNTLANVSEGEPFLNYQEQALREDIPIEEEWMINDIIYNVEAIPAGDQGPRGIYFTQSFSDDFEATAPGTPGPMIYAEREKEIEEPVEYKLGIGATDNFVANNIMLEELRLLAMNAGKKFSRKLKIDGANLIASKLQAGNHPGNNLPYSISTTDTVLSAKIVDEIVDSYTSTGSRVNRAIGKSAILTELRRNADVVFVANNPHYVGTSTRVMDIGMSDGNIATCKIDYSGLDAAYTGQSFFTFDVMNTMVLIIKPGLEQDEEVRDSAVGAVLRWLRTTAGLWIPKPGLHDIRKVTRAT